MVGGMFGQNLLVNKFNNWLVNWLDDLGLLWLNGWFAYSYLLVG